MSDAELRELQDPETWEAGGEVQPAAKSGRAIVSVAFTRADFERVAIEAQRRGMKTSEFIRAAALDRIDAPRGTARVVSVSGLNDHDYPQNRTRAPKGTAQTKIRSASQVTS